MPRSTADEVRAALPPGATITSSYRTPQHNRDVGGVRNSYHTRGSAQDPRAFDIVPPKGMTMAQLRAHMARSGVQLEENINEGDHVHVGFSGAPGMYQAQADTARTDREAPYLVASRGLALREAFHDAQITDRMLGFLQADGRSSFARQQERVFGTPAEISAEEANERFAVPGRLSFNEPITAAMAGWRQGLAQREAFRDEVVTNAQVGPLELIGAGIAGSILDPVGLPLWAVPELAAGRALRTGAAATRLGRLAPALRGAVTGAAEGVAGSLVYEGANLWLHHEAADDYDFGDAAANVIFGGVFGAVAGAGGGWWEGRTQGRAPRVVEDLTDNGRMGAFHEAMEAVIEDRPVDLGPMLAREAEARASGRVSREALATLDEVGGAPTLAARFGREDVAVTPRGAEVPVRYAVVEADDLVTSHDDDLFRNPEYPAELQPRQRDRAGAQARNRSLEAELNPKRLMSDVGAETGAPIVSGDGTVESGNGRTIALRRSYRTGSGAATRYRAELQAQGFDVEGMSQPVLVRVRTSRLEGAERVRLTRDMNAEATEAYSPSERASADAAGLDDDLLGLLDGSDLNAAGNRRFVRAFLDRVAGDDLNRMTTADGRLSDVGHDRISAAMVARAYGDRQLTEALFEATDSHIKTIGKALADAAPEWAAMRGAVARGEVPAEVDPTDALKAAVSFVRQVRQRGGNLAETMDLTIGQFDAFNGAAMTPETEAFVRGFFRTSEDGATLWRSPRSAASLADGLRWLAGEIKKAQPGPDLFGDVADAATGRQLLDAFSRWLGKSGDDGQPAPDLFGLRKPDDGPPVVDGGDVRPDGQGPGRQPGRQGAGREAESVGLLDTPAVFEPHPSYGTAEHWAEFQRTYTNLATPQRYKALYGASPPKTPKGEAPKPPKGDPFADPEVAALAKATDDALRRAGLDPAAIETPAGQDPQTVADAITAGAFCLKGGA